MYNAEAFISDAIQSVINQTYTSWELLLIDDCSTDKTLEIAKSFQNEHSKIKLFANAKNFGAAITRNKGIEAAKGDYIAFLDGDDVWKPEKLEKQLAFFNSQDCDVCFSSYYLIDEQGVLLNKEVKALETISYQKLLKSNYIGNLTGMYNAKKLGKITSPNLRKRQDWLLWLAALKKSRKPAEGILEPLAYYRIRKSSMSSNKFQLIKHNYWVYRKGLDFSILKSVYSMVVFLIEHFFVKSRQTVSIHTK